MIVLRLIRRHVVVAALITACIATTIFAAPAHAGTSSPTGGQHIITCSLSVEVPFRSGTTIYGYARRKCSDSPDISIFSIQLQRYYNGGWHHYGESYTTSSTGVNLYNFDSQRCYNRGTSQRYRTRARYEVFHGTWTKEVKNSAGFTTKCL